MGVGSGNKESRRKGRRGGGREGGGGGRGGGVGGGKNETCVRQIWHHQSHDHFLNRAWSNFFPYRTDMQVTLSIMQ